MAMHADALKKAEQIARMLWQGYGRGRTARMMGMSYEGLLRITKTPEFQEIDQRIREEVLGKMDATLDRRTDVSMARQDMADEMEEALPEAWKILMANLRENRDLKAALEVLDRDPQKQFTKGRSTSAVAATQIGVGVNVQIDSQALVQAVREADKTSELIDRASNVKPAEA